jgi:hypothetical protein
MPEIFNEQTVTGITYPRCKRIEIQNKQNELPTMQMVTERVLEIGDKVIYSGDEVSNIIFDQENPDHITLMTLIDKMWKQEINKLNESQESV